MRTIVDIPEEDIRWLDQRAAETGKSRTAVVREAVEAYRVEVGGTDEERKLAALEVGFGLWVRHGVKYNPHDYDRVRRAEWTRPWDDDYEEVRAESPEMFTEADDRERAHYLRLFGQRGGTAEDATS
jgi:hypothetical protein